MSKLQPAQNMFADLVSDEDDEEEVDERDFEVKGQAVIDPNTELGKFEKYTQRITTVIELGFAVNKILTHSKKTSRTYDVRFDTYDSISIEEYQEHIEARIHCFDDRITDEILDYAFDKFEAFEDEQKQIPALHGLLLKAVELLNQSKPDGHGYLLLLAYICSKKKEYFKPAVFKVNVADIKQAGRAICWVFSYFIEHQPNYLSGSGIMHFFRDVFLSKDEGASATAVCASHIAAKQFLAADRTIVSPDTYVILSRLTYLKDKEFSSKNRNRDQHVAIVLEPVLDHVRFARHENVIDIPKTVLDVCSDDMPGFVNDAFSDGIYDAAFLMGWTKLCEEGDERALNMLESLRAQMPPSVAKRFPAPKPAAENEDPMLSKAYKSLRWRSLRALIVGSAAAATFVLHTRGYI